MSKIIVSDCEKKTFCFSEFKFSDLFKTLEENLSNGVQIPQEIKKVILDCLRMEEAEDKIIKISQLMAKETIDVKEFIESKKVNLIKYVGNYYDEKEQKVYEIIMIKNKYFYIINNTIVNIGNNYKFTIWCKEYESITGLKSLNEYEFKVEMLNEEALSRHDEVINTYYQTLKEALKIKAELGENAFIYEKIEDEWKRHLV